MNNPLNFELLSVMIYEKEGGGFTPQLEFNEDLLKLMGIDFNEFLSTFDKEKAQEFVTYVFDHMSTFLDKDVQE